MSEISEFVSINSDGTALLADGRAVRLIAGRNNVLGYRDLAVDRSASLGLVSSGVGGVGGVDQIGARPVPTMGEALGG